MLSIQRVDLMIMLYFAALVALGILTRIVSMWFTHGMERVVDMGPRGHLGGAHERYTNRALLGLREIPTRGLKLLAWVLRVLVVATFFAQVGAIYMAFSIGSPEPGCDACKFDPHGKSPMFWAALGLAVIVILVPDLAGVMVMRADPRQIEATGRFDVRRLKMGLRWIFQDRSIPKDAIASVLRQVCRWLIFLGILDLLAIVALMIVPP